MFRSPWWCYGALLSAFCCSSLQLAAARPAATDHEARQMQSFILQDWLADNFAFRLKNHGGQLELGGLISVQGTGRSETVGGCQQIGPRAACTRPRYGYEVGFVLTGAYRSARSWANFYLDYSNDMGILPPESDGLSLDRAFLGHRFGGSERMQIELDVGRRFLGDIFSSAVQFDAQLDGVDGRIAYQALNGTELYLQGAGFLVQQRWSQWAWAAEAGALSILGTQWNLQLSWIDWFGGSGSCTCLPGEKAEHAATYRYANVQPQLSYELEIPFGGVPRYSLFYAGVSYNVLARPEWITLSPDSPLLTLCCASVDPCHEAPCCHQLEIPKRPWAAFIGLTAGELGRAGDWTFDLHYEYVQEQAIPSFDLAGIGLGNCPDYGLYEEGLGDAGYQGLFFRIVFQVTQHITTQGMIELSESLPGEHICPRTYQRGRLAFTYAF